MNVNVTSRSDGRMCKYGRLKACVCVFVHVYGVKMLSAINCSGVSVKVV